MRSFSYRWALGVFAFILAVLSSGCSQSQTSPSIRFPYLWLDKQGFGGDIDQQDFIEPSGIAFHPLRKTLFVVSDEGQITEIQTDGTPIAIADVPGDLEGVAVEPSTGLLYVVVEAEDVILELDPDRLEIQRRFPISREFDGDRNFLQKQLEEFDNGCESVVFVPNAAHSEGGTFYIGNQWDPPRILEVEVPIRSAGEEGAEARILRVLPFLIDDPAAMYYDPVSALLNVVSDADNILIELTLDGELVREYAFLGDEQEGITRDDEGNLYIAQDSGGIIKVKDLRVP